MLATLFAPGFPTSSAMLLYFDFDTWLKMLGLAWSEPSLCVRLRYLAMLVLWVPLVSTFHALCFALDWLLFPSLRRTDISKPVFIVGHGRSGTTLTFRLLDQDEGRFSSFKLWECYFPSLLQKKFIRAIASLDKPWLGGLLGRIVERFEEKRYGPSRHMHEMGLNLAEEDDISLFYSMASGFWMTKMPWMGELDFFYVDQWQGNKGHRRMRFYRELARRQLCLNGGDKIHLSKNPYWAGRVQTLLDVFPDARIIVNLRNPHEAIPSLIKLNLSAWKQMGWDQQRVADSIEVLKRQSIYNYRNPINVLSRNTQVPHYLLNYSQLTEDPARAVAEIYRELNIPLCEQYQQQLAELGGREKKHKTSFTYSLEEFGIDPDWVEAEFSDLFDRFGWPEHQSGHNETEAIA